MTSPVSPRAPRCQECREPMKGHPRRNGRIWHENTVSVNDSVTESQRTMTKVENRVTVGSQQPQDMQPEPSLVRFARPRSEFVDRARQIDGDSTRKKFHNELTREPSLPLVGSSNLMPYLNLLLVVNGPTKITIQSQSSLPGIDSPLTWFGRAQPVRHIYKSNRREEVLSIVQDPCSKGLEEIVQVVPNGHPTDGPWYISVGTKDDMDDLYTTDQEEDAEEVGGKVFGERRSNIIGSWKQIICFLGVIVLVVVWNNVHASLTVPDLERERRASSYVYNG